MSKQDDKLLDVIQGQYLVMVPIQQLLGRVNMWAIIGLSGWMCGIQNLIFVFYEDMAVWQTGTAVAVSFSPNANRVGSLSITSHLSCPFISTNNKAPPLHPTHKQNGEWLSDLVIGVRSPACNRNKESRSTTSFHHINQQIAENTGENQLCEHVSRWKAVLKTFRWTPKGWFFKRHCRAK